MRDKGSKLVKYQALENSRPGPNQEEDAPPPAQAQIHAIQVKITVEKTYNFADLP
jgi:hypothetical protein